MGPRGAAALCAVLLALVASAAASDFCGGGSAGGGHADLVVVLDATESMKLVPVVGLVKGLADLLMVGPGEGESRLALVTFRRDATTRVGFTSGGATDRSLFYSELDKVTPDGFGTATGPALEYASRMLQSAARVDAVKVVVIATDFKPISTTGCKNLGLPYSSATACAKQAFKDLLQVADFVVHITLNTGDLPVNFWPSVGITPQSSVYCQPSEGMAASCLAKFRDQMCAADTKPPTSAPSLKTGKPSTGKPTRKPSTGKPTRNPSTGKPSTGKPTRKPSTGKPSTGKPTTKPVLTDANIRQAAQDWCAGSTSRDAVEAAYGPIANWDTTRLTDMSGLFTSQPSCNPDISAWNTAKVTTFTNMFYDARVFNQDISSWNTGRATEMRAMFSFATAFNQDISSWNTGRVTNMMNMFFPATAFNQKLCWTRAQADVDLMFYGSGCPGDDDSTRTCWGTGTWPGTCT
jgi:surface protein